jgi:hypothetical protein
MPPISTAEVPSKSRGKLARDEGAQRPVGKDSPVIQPNLEIVGRSLDHHRGLETRVTHFFEGIRADVVYQAERVRPLPPDEDVCAASVLSPQPFDTLADLIDTLVAVQNHSVASAHHSDFKAPAPHRGELLAYNRFRD